MARLDEVCEAIADRARSFTEYPVHAEDPAAINVAGPVGVVHAVSGTITPLMGGPATYQWLDSIRLDFYCSLAQLTPQVVKTLRALPEVISDAFAPGQQTTGFYRLGGLVNHCILVGYEFGAIDRGGTEYSVARFTLDVKRTRAAGEA